MPVTDPIADLLTRIRNAHAVHKESVLVPYSKNITELIKLIQEEGFISSFKPELIGKSRMYDIKLRYYHEGKKPAINGLKRVSSPGLRSYTGYADIPRYYGGLGVCFISTPKGIMTGEKARKLKVGGELLFYIW